MPKITPNLWFDTQGKEAAAFLNDPDQARAQRGMKAMLGMKKIDLATLRAAADQASTSA